MTSTANEDIKSKPAASSVAPSNGNVLPFRRVVHARDVRTPKSDARPSLNLTALNGEDDDPDPAAA